MKTLILATLLAITAMSGVVVGSQSAAANTPVRTAEPRVDFSLPGSGKVHLCQGRICTVKGPAVGGR